MLRDQENHATAMRKTGNTCRIKLSPEFFSNKRKRLSIFMLSLCLIWCLRRIRTPFPSPSMPHYSPLSRINTRFHLLRSPLKTALQRNDFDTFSTQYLALPLPSINHTDTCRFKWGCIARGNLRALG